MGGSAGPRLAVVVRYVGPSAVALVHHCLTCNFQGQCVGGLCLCVCVCLRRWRSGCLVGRGRLCAFAVSKKLAATCKAVASRSCMERAFGHPLITGVRHRARFCSFTHQVFFRPLGPRQLLAGDLGSYILELIFLLRCCRSCGIVEAPCTGSAGCLGFVLGRLLLLLGFA